MSELLDASIEYLGMGFHLLPLHGKRPVAQHWSWDDSVHGEVETDEDRAKLAEVFDDPYVTGVAILIPQHVLVADIDTDEAADLFIEYAGGVPNTRTAQTKNGLHLWFLAPGAESSIWLGDRVLLFKGFGGYVVAPPSRHFTDDTVTEQDGVYTWIGDDWRVIDWLPDGFERPMRAREVMSQHAPPPVIEPFPVVVGLGDKRWRFELHWPIDGLCRAIEEAPDGNQNNMIAWAALTCAENGVPYDVAMTQLLEAALRGNHPRSRAVTTIRSAYRRKGAR